MMNKPIFSIILAALPFLSYFLQNKFSKKNSRLNVFYAHWTVRYADWLFVPFNLIFLYAISSVLEVVLAIFALSFMANLIMHHTWPDCHFYHKNSKRLAPAGYVHLIFSTVETALIILFFLNFSAGAAAYAGLLMLALVATGIIFGSYRIHNGKPLLTDLITAAVLYVLIILKI